MTTFTPYPPGWLFKCSQVQNPTHPRPIGVESALPPLRVSQRSGQDFVVMSAQDWEREQETLHCLQSGSLMQRIADYLKAHAKRAGCSISP